MGLILGQRVTALNELSMWWLRKRCAYVNQRFPLKDAADAHKALEARATSGSTILTI